MSQPNMAAFLTQLSLTLFFLLLFYFGRVAFTIVRPVS